MSKEEKFVFIVHLIALVLAFIFFGWKLALIVLLLEFKIIWRSNIEGKICSQWREISIL